MVRSGRPKLVKESRMIAFMMDFKIVKKYREYFKTNELAKNFREIISDWIRKDKKIGKVTRHFGSDDFVPHRINILFSKEDIEYIDKVYKKYGYARRSAFLNDILTAWINDAKT